MVAASHFTYSSSWSGDCATSSAAYMVALLPSNLLSQGRPASIPKYWVSRSITSNRLLGLQAGNRDQRYLPLEAQQLCKGSCHKLPSSTSFARAPGRSIVSPRCAG